MLVATHVLITVPMMQWIQDADLDPNDPANSSLVELRRLLGSTQVNLEEQPRFRLRARDASYMAPPRRGARERQALSRARWGGTGAGSPSKQPADVDTPRPKGRPEGGQQLVISLRIWQRRLHDQLSMERGLQAELASAPPPPCVCEHVCVFLV